MILRVRRWLLRRSLRCERFFYGRYSWSPQAIEKMVDMAFPKK